MGVLDQEAKRQLRRWPERTKVWSAGNSSSSWVRAQPVSPKESLRAPRLAAPGTKQFSIQPDGMWLSLGSTDDDDVDEATYVDCLVVEACASSQNLNDKRSRYSARTSALVVDLRQGWLDGFVAVQKGGKRSRRALLGRKLPDADQILIPVRHLRVLYAVSPGLYGRMLHDVVLEAHEYACQIQMLGQYPSPEMQRFLKRMRPSLQFARRT